MVRVVYQMDRNSESAHPRIVYRRAIALAYGLLCHGLFAAGVGMMMYQMYFGMSRSWGDLAPHLGWLANAILLIQFPVAHSLLLSKRGRSFLTKLAPRKFGDHLHVTTYVIVASLQVLALFLLWTPTGVTWWEASGAMLWLLTALYAASWFLLGKAIFDAGFTLQTGSLGWWAVYRNRRPAYPGMPTQGLFTLCRQPIYLAFACTLWTVPVWTPDQLLIATVLTAYCVIGPLFKEARSASLFGEAFADYRKIHPYLIPTGPRTPYRLNDLSIYDRYAERWWDGSQRWLRILQNVVPARLAYFDTIVDWRGKAVLDLGCGGGFMSEAIALRGAKVTGVDPAPGAVAVANRHAAQSSLSICYLVGTGEHLPIRDASMDHVVCVDVLEHVADLDRVIAEIRRVLRPGGAFLFDTINRTLLARLVYVVFGERLLRIAPPGTHDPSKFIKPEELRGKLEAAGFQVSEFIGLGPRRLNRRLDFVFGALPSRSIVYMGSATLPGQPLRS